MGIAKVLASLSVVVLFASCAPLGGGKSGEPGITRSYPEVFVALERDEGQLLCPKSTRRQGPSGRDAPHCRQLGVGQPKLADALCVEASELRGFIFLPRRGNAAVRIVPKLGKDFPFLLVDGKPCEPYTGSGGRKGRKCTINTSLGADTYFYNIATPDPSQPDNMEVHGCVLDPRIIINRAAVN